MNDEQQVTEPVAGEHPAPSAAGSSASGHAQPRRRFPIGRIIAVALLAGLGVASPGLGVLTLPFATALLALGLLYGAGRTLVVGAALVTAVVAVGSLTAVTTDPAWLVIAAVAAFLSIALGVGQYQAARRDPGAESLAAATGATWPEPRVDRGFSHALLTWVAAAAALVALVGIAFGANELRDGASSAVREAYSSYVSECADGMLAQQDELCANMEEQRSQALDIARDEAPALLAFLAAIFAVGAAGTSHLLVVARARAVAKQGREIETRPAWKLRDLELHWSFAYFGVAAVMAWFAADAASGALADWLLATAVGLGTVTALVLFAQGAGLLAWVFTRRRMPLWYRLLLVVVALLVLPAAMALVTGCGLLDMGLHPRRRAAAKAAAP